MAIAFEQKRRDRAIDITDIAIDKVPRTRFYGIDDAGNRFIQDRHKDILRVAKSLNRVYNSNEMEAGILIDIHSWRYILIEGREPRKVEIRDNKDAYNMLEYSMKNQLMFLHNHPSTGTFSAIDLGTFWNNDSIYIMTIVGNDGGIYTLTKQAYFDKFKVTNEYTRLVNKYSNYKYNATLAVREILKNAEKFDMIYKKGRHKK